MLSLSLSLAMFVFVFCHQLGFLQAVSMNEPNMCFTSCYFFLCTIWLLWWNPLNVCSANVCAWANELVNQRDYVPIELYIFVYGSLSEEYTFFYRPYNLIWISCGQMCDNKLDSIKFRPVFWSIDIVYRSEEWKINSFHFIWSRTRNEWERKFKKEFFSIKSLSI